jgi:hypothetical protein
VDLNSIAVTIGVREGKNYGEGRAILVKLLSQRFFRQKEEAGANLETWLTSSYFATLPRNHLAKVELPPSPGKPIIVTRSTVISLISNDLCQRR